MNVLRGIVATIFIFIFTLISLVTTLGWGLERTIVPQTAVTIIERARVGERLTAVLPDYIKQGLSGPAALLSDENIERFVAEALPAVEADSMLRSLAGGVVSYIRGEADTISKVDLAPTISRAVAAAKKIIPGKQGVQLATMIQTQFKAAGWDKGLEIPHEQLDAVRNAFSQFHLGATIALAAVILLFLLIAAVAPHGLRGRLRWCAVALIVPGCLSIAVAVAALIAPGIMLGLALGGNNIPPVVQSLAKDAVEALGGVLALNIFIIAAIYVGSGALLIAVNLILRKRGVSSAPASTVKK